MNRRSEQLILLLLMLVATMASAQPIALQTIVDQFYPQKYIDDAARLGNQLNHETCYAVYQALPNGVPEIIIAGYADGFQGTVKVLSSQATGLYRVAYEPPGLLFGGIGCDVELVDVDGDGVNEIHISFGSAQGVAGDWIFKWDGSQLTPLGPVFVRNGISYTKFANIAFEDLYHDGTLQVLSLTDAPPPSDGSMPSPISFLYRLVNGRFVLDSPVAFVESYTLQTGASPLETTSFNLAKGSNGPYTLTVVNGYKDGTGRASSAVISVNGTTVVYPSQVNQQVETLSVPLSGLQPQNTITVELNGNPGGQIQVLVKDQTLGFLNQ